MSVRTPNQIPLSPLRELLPSLISCAVTGVLEPSSVRVSREQRGARERGVKSMRVLPNSMHMDMIYIVLQDAL